MNWREFIVTLIKSLAWAGTVLILVFYFRKLIKEGLLMLTRLKYGDLEVDFAHELKQVEKEAKASDIVPQGPKTIAPTKKDSLKFLEDASQLAQQSPELSVGFAWQAVEVQLLDSALSLSIPQEEIALRHPLGHAHILLEKSLIDLGTLDVLRKMHRLRNLAVHGAHGASPISTPEAREFIALATGIVDKLRAATAQVRT